VNPTAALLAILIIPLVVIGGVIVIGLPGPEAQKLFLYCAVGYTVGTVATTFTAGTRRPDLSKGIDEPAITRYGLVVGASTAFGLGVLTFAMASGRPVIGFAGAAVGGAWFCVWLPPKFRTITAECSIVINRDVHSVFALMSDFRTMVKWYPGAESVEMVTPEPIGPGTRFKESGHLPSSGNRIAGQDQIVDFEPDRRYSSTTLGAMKNLDVVTFETVGAGTRVSLRSQTELQPWMALIGAALFKRTLARDVVNMREAAWARAKQLLEGQETPA
jgi:carbon monoxide dehydrogenase subunit G